MPSAYDRFAMDMVRPSNRPDHVARYESFAARFHDLRFLIDVDPELYDVRSLGPHTCGWDYGCLHVTPDWFDGYILPKDPLSDLSGPSGTAPDMAVHVLLDHLTGLIHATDGDAIIGAPNAMPALSTPDANGGGRSFGCFAAGTQIATELGPIPVEALDIGNMIHTVRDGRLKPIVWAGHRTIHCDRHPHPSRIWPIRISQSAFGPDLPQRDLLLSPDHAVYWIDALIPVRCLMNGATITQTPVDQVTYYHFELKHHDVVLAEGMPAETYLDTGPEAVFPGHGSPIGLYPDLASRLWDAKACAPLVVVGPILDSLRQWLGINAARRNVIDPTRVKASTRRGTKIA